MAITPTGGKSDSGAIAILRWAPERKDGCTGAVREPLFVAATGLGSTCRSYAVLSGRL